MTTDPVPSTPARSRREQTRLAVVGVAGALMALFAVLNLDDVKVHWVVTTSDSPLIVVIALSFGLGVAVGALLMKRRSGSA